MACSFVFISFFFPLSFFGDYTVKATPLPVVPGIPDIPQQQEARTQTKKQQTTTKLQKKERTQTKANKRPINHRICLVD